MMKFAGAGSLPALHRIPTNFRGIRPDGDRATEDFLLFSRIIPIQASYVKFNKTDHPRERWPSGLRRTLGKRVYFNEYRGFESHSLRHKMFIINRLIGRLELLSRSWQICVDAAPKEA